MPSVDPALHLGLPHDVLAAEEFGMPSVDPRLHHHGPVSLPSDPTGIAEPHDVLAAEEFALPAGPPGATLPVVGAVRGRGPLFAALGALVLIVLRGRRRRRRRNRHP